MQSREKGRESVCVSVCVHAFACTCVCVFVRTTVELAQDKATVNQQSSSFFLLLFSYIYFFLQKYVLRGQVVGKYKSKKTHQKEDFWISLKHHFIWMVFFWRGFHSVLVCMCISELWCVHFRAVVCAFYSCGMFISELWYVHFRAIVCVFQSFVVFSFLCSNKPQCNDVHPYIVFIPVSISNFLYVMTWTLYCSMIIIHF